MREVGGRGIIVVSVSKSSYPAYQPAYPAPRTLNPTKNPENLTLNNNVYSFHVLFCYFLAANPAWEFPKVRAPIQSLYNFPYGDWSKFPIIRRPIFGFPL